MTDPIALGVDQRYVFWHQQLALLKDRDPLDVLAETPVLLMRFIQECEPGQWERAEPGRWSPRQVVTHLQDIEWVFGFRVRTVLFDDHPRLMPMDQDRWVAGQEAHGVSVAERIGEFCQLRAVNLRLWRRMTDRDLDRTGRHDDAGIDLTLRTMRAIQAGHDLWHLRAIREALGIRASS